MAIAIYDGTSYYKVKSFNFSGGELQVNIPGLELINEKVPLNIKVICRIQSSNDVMELILATEILNRLICGEKKLIIPYFPYARQDRVMKETEAFSLKAFCKIINNLNYDKVICYDLHSDVATALIENIKHKTQLEIMSSDFKLKEYINEYKPNIISPDAGAHKKSFEIAKRLGLNLVNARKNRDTNNGEITNTTVEKSLCRHTGHALIVDDICDGGRTFIELAKVLKSEKIGYHHVALYVTHGIFSKGYKVFDGLIDKIFTTDTFLPNAASEPYAAEVAVNNIPYAFER